MSFPKRSLVPCVNNSGLAEDKLIEDVVGGPDTPSVRCRVGELWLDCIRTHLAKVRELGDCDLVGKRTIRPPRFTLESEPIAQWMR